MKSSELSETVRRFAGHNLGLKLLSLCLAVACWLFVAGESRVLVGFSVPLEFRDVPRGMTVTNKVARQVEVRLAGPSSFLSALKHTDIAAAIDLSGARAGRQSIPVDDRVVKVPPGITVQRIFPASVEVVLERTERRVVPVIARVGGAQAVRRNVTKVEVDPPGVEIEALPEEFSRMPAVYTEEVAPERDTDVFSALARVELRETHAKIVGSPDVRVKVYFRK
ncbi:MAG TPA: CdaR family protein [Candidatus Deferrimicrobiaceae bacterium]